MISQLASQPGPATVPRNADVFDKLSEDEIVILFFLVVFLLIFGVILTLLQCRQLQDAMVKRKRWKQQQEWRTVSTRLGSSRSSNNTTTQEFRSAHASAKSTHQHSLQTLQTELEGLRQMQQNVRSQVSTLEQYVDAAANKVDRDGLQESGSLGMRQPSRSSSAGLRRRHLG